MTTDQVHNDLVKKSIVAGSKLDFWFTGSDDIYDELYGRDNKAEACLDLKDL